MKRRWLLYILLQLSAYGSVAQTRFTDGDIYYITTSDTTVAVTHPDTGSYSVSGLFIPEEATNNGTVYSVTSIADSAFMNSSLNYLDIPATVSRIGRKAFWGLFENSTDTGAIVMRSVHPPTLSDVPFTGFCCFIYITCSSYSFYENATGNWIYISVTNRFRGLEGDIERVIDTTVCVGPNVFELYNPYHDSTIYLYRNIIQHSTFTYIDMMIPIQGCRVTSRLLVDVLPDGSYNEVTLYLCSQNNNEVSFRLDQHNFDTILTTVGNHEFRFPDGDCDDIYHVTVVNTDATLGIENINLCDGDAYYHMDENSMFVSIEQDSIYYKHMSMNGRGGCDSIVQVNIDFHPLPDIRDTIHKCQGQRYLWSREGYNENNQFVRLSSYCDSAGVYVDTTLRSEWGCPMSHTLNLFIHTDPQVHIYDTICYNGRHYNNHGFYIPQYQITPNRLQTIDRTNNNRSIYGCDSTTYLHLTVLPTQSTNLGNVNLCRDSVYTFNNRTITTSGTYRDTLSTTLGCDSVVSINVILRENNSSITTQNICQGSSYTWNISGYDENGNNISHTLTVAESGIYTDSTLKTQYGCANFHRLILTVNPVYNDTIRDTICYGNSYNENDFYIPVSQTSNVLQTISRVNNRVTSKNCDSITTLLLTIKPSASLHIYDTIIEGESLTYNNQTYTHPGTYIHTFESANGCDSVVFLNLMVHMHVNTVIYDSICQGQTYNENGFEETASGVYRQDLETTHGSDSTVILYLVVHPTYNYTIYDTICQGETYNQYGFVQDTAGTNTIQEETIYGCDSIVTLHLTVNPVYDTVIHEEILEGHNYVLNNNVYTQTGIYYDTLSTINGCDSTFVLNLTVWPNVETVFYDSICQGQTYNENGFEETASGVYRQDLETTHGSDSTVILYLVVHPTYNYTIYDTICQGETYNQYGFVQDTAGTNTIQEETIYGCDSIVTLHLTVNPVYDTLLFAEICRGETYMFHSRSLSESGLYVDTLSTHLGCDSIVKLNLTIHPVFDTLIVDSVCYGSSYTLNGFDENEAGTYTQYLTTINGCDSIVRLRLSLMKYVDTIYANICDGESYTLNNFNENTTGIYIDSLQSQYGCDSLVVLILTVRENYCDTIYAETCDNIPYTQNGFNADTSGVYTQHLETVYGCDSTVTLILTVYPTYIVPLNKEICEGETYIDHGFWLTYSGTFLISSHQSCHGCDSLFVLNLTVNPTYDELIEASICEGDTFSYPGYENLTAWETGIYHDIIESSNGCDSAKTLILTVNPIKRDTLYGAICDNESYNMNGFSESEPGIYIDTLTSITGCDSIVWLYLEQREKYEDTAYIEICDGYNYIFGDMVLTETGIYNGQLESIYGCDSLVELHLTVHPVYSDTIYRRICRGSSYIDQDFNESSDGTYSVHYSSIHGCDSIITLVLETVYYNDTITDTICKGLVYDFYGTSLTETGIYTHNIRTSEMGCDSIVTLFLQVNHPYIDSIYASICEGDVYDRYGFNATEQGRYVILYSTMGGCDSIKVLNLTVRSSYNDTITAHICQGEIYNNFGFLADATGLHTRYYHTTLGCDSIITLNLFVHNRAFDTIEATICEGDVYRENNFEESEEGEYRRELQTVYGCDSLVVLNLNVAQHYYDTISKMINEGDYYNNNGFYESKEGIYTQYHISQNGCDSVVVLNLRVNGEADLYVPNTITPQGNIAENKKFYLIPSNEKLVIDDVFIYNRWGELIFRSQYNAEAWDGKYKGKLCQQGAYTYLILYHTTNSSDIRRSRKGTVLVLY